MGRQSNNGNACSSGCGCGTQHTKGLARRDFMKMVGAGAATLSTAGSWQVFAGPFESKDFNLIPADKKLDPAWVRSLFERGQKQTYSNEELKYIGMPVGGICCGQLYLGGDGRLWLWDIFKSQYHREPDHHQRLKAMTICGHYTDPPTPETAVTRDNGAHVEQGFVLQVKQEGRTTTRFLDRRGFNMKHITFRGEYPIGRVAYNDPDLPVQATLEAFSPFIPLRAEDSAIPATVLSWKLTNTSEQPAQVQLAGYLENAVCPYYRQPSLGQRRTTVVRHDHADVLLHEAQRTVQNKSTVRRDDIRQTDAPAPDERKLEELHGYGSLALALLDETESAYANPKVGSATAYAPDEMFQSVDHYQAVSAFDERPIGVLGTTVTLAPGQTRTVRFVLGWYFPDYNQKDYGGMLKIQDFARLRRQYAQRFASAGDVVRMIAERWDELAETTLTWNRTWYDSTLPYWLLDRAFISLDCLASQTCHWFDNGRFWGWEGVDCCEGTCTHVWQYAQGLARIFPEIERDLRQRVDFGLSFNDASGVIGHRGEIHRTPAVDGQAGTILRALREHRMSKDGAFLTAIWPRIKKAFGYLERLDTNGDSLLDANQPHTLDAAWAGEIAWISSLYLAAAQACVEMADEMNDTAFARHCEKIVARGRKQLVNQLFNGEYFIHKPDPKKPRMINTNDGCHIDQVFGQSFAYQVGLSERIVQKREAISALQSLWKYNFAPDAGGYALKQRDIGQTFRWYAMPGEAGLLMCTWPKGGADKALPGVPRRSKENPAVWTGPGGYFNECMNGFEYQAASHMIYEGEPGSGLVEKGLAVIRAVHDRYHASSRNPYNEIECSDHYARSMASYGVFLAVCGFEYHGPKGYLSFAPRMTPEYFRAAFTTAQGWGTYEQKRHLNRQNCRIHLKWGQLRLCEVVFVPPDMTIHKVTTSIDLQPLDCDYELKEDRVHIRFRSACRLRAGQDLEVTIN